MESTARVTAKVAVAFALLICTSSLSCLHRSVTGLSLPRRLQGVQPSVCRLTHKLQQSVCSGSSSMTSGTAGGMTHKKTMIIDVPCQDGNTLQLSVDRVETYDPRVLAASVATHSQQCYITRCRMQDMLSTSANDVEQQTIFLTNGGAVSDKRCCGVAIKCLMYIHLKHQKHLLHAVGR